MVLIPMLSCLRSVQRALVPAAFPMEEEVESPPDVRDLRLPPSVEEDTCFADSAAAPAVGHAKLSDVGKHGSDCSLPSVVVEQDDHCSLPVANSALRSLQSDSDPPCLDDDRFQRVPSRSDASSFHEVLGAATRRETLLYKIRTGWEHQRMREQDRDSTDKVLQYPCDGPTLDRLHKLATLDVGDLSQDQRCRLGMQPSYAEMQCLAHLPLCFHVRLCLDLQAESRRLEEARMIHQAELDQTAALRTFFCAGCARGSAVVTRSHENPAVVPRSRESSDRFKFCSGCFTTRYCTRECQVSHWPAHRKLCEQQRTKRLKRLRPSGQRLFALLDRRSAHEQISFCGMSGSYRERDHALCGFIAAYPDKEFRAVYDSSHYTIYILYRNMASTRHRVLYPLPTHGKMTLGESSARRCTVKTPAHTMVVVDRSAGNCLLCDAAEARILLLPCHHLCLCVECAHTRRFMRRCPMCSADVYQLAWTTVDESMTGGFDPS